MSEDLQDDLLKIEVRPKWYWQVVNSEGKVLSKGPGFDSKEEAIAEARCEIEDSIYKYVLEVIEDYSKT
jgi:hypothetical protein